MAIKSQTIKPRWVRPHYSWSQYHTFVAQGWPEYARKYVYGDNPTNPAMELGKRVAEMIESDEIPDEAVLEHLKMFLPPADCHEHKIENTFRDIPLLSFYDGFTKRPMKIDEYKTGRLWTQKMADETEQLDWYVLQAHLKFGVRPETIPLRLVWMPTEWNGGEPFVTGEIHVFETRRTMADMILIGKKIFDSWNKLGILVAKEYASMGM